MTSDTVALGCQGIIGTPRWVYNHPTAGKLGKPAPAAFLKAKHSLVERICKYKLKNTRNEVKVLIPPPYK